MEWCQICAELWARWKGSRMWPNENPSPNVEHACGGRTVHQLSAKHYFDFFLFDSWRVWPGSSEGGRWRRAATRPRVRFWPGTTQSRWAAGTNRAFLLLGHVSRSSSSGVCLFFPCSSSFLCRRWFMGELFFSSHAVDFEHIFTFVVTNEHDSQKQSYERSVFFQNERV